MTEFEHAELVAERDFLLRSIADLDEEQAAGDLAADDFAALRDDYVARAATVMRALDGDATATPAAVVAATPRTRNPRRTALVVVACLAVAGLAGVALAGAAGSRPAGGPLTGSLPQNTADQLAQATELIGAGKPVDALKLYDTILKKDPQNATALAYKGWLLRLAGADDKSLQEKGLTYEDQAVAADPTYPDAHFFRGMMLWQDKGDPAGAVGEFRLFLANRPPQAMVSLVEDALKRAAAEAGIPVD
ncbi:MAG TPA: tetratricopeptide repeat protein [Acidimicrobiales bacterium]|nr:tetratricopeptide repeat protein [Acidimicrobiales bacterium]